MSSGQSDSGHAFDQLSRQVAQAYAAGNPEQGRRLGDRAVRDHLLPRVTQLARLKVFRRDLAEDVAAHALLRVAEDWSKGKAVTWPMLTRVVVNCAVDLTKRDERVPLVDVGTDDEAQLEAFLAAEGAAPAAATPEDEALDKVQVEQLARELRMLKRPRWAAYVLAWNAGYRSAPDVEHVTGIRQGRVRQIKMDVCQYLWAYHADLAPRFGCTERAAAEPAASAGRSDGHA